MRNTDHQFTRWTKTEDHKRARTIILYMQELDNIKTIQTQNDSKYNNNNNAPQQGSCQQCSQASPRQPRSKIISIISHHSIGDMQLQCERNPRYSLKW